MVPPTCSGGAGLPRQLVGRSGRVESMDKRMGIERIGGAVVDEEKKGEEETRIRNDELKGDE